MMSSLTHDVKSLMHRVQVDGAVQYMYIQRTLKEAVTG